MATLENTLERNELVLEKRKQQVILEYDEDGFNNPRDWDNFGTMVCFHKRYSLGDRTNLSSADFNSWDELENYIKKELNAVVVLPLSLYDHSQITMSIGKLQGWDCGQVGFIYVTREQLKKEYNRVRLSKKLREKIENRLEKEVETYNRYLHGTVFKIILQDVFMGDGHMITEVQDSLGGLYSNDLREVRKEIKENFGLEENDYVFINNTYLD